MTAQQINNIIKKNPNSPVIQKMKVVATDNKNIEVFVKLDGILHRYTKSTELLKLIKKYK